MSERLVGFFAVLVKVLKKRLQLLAHAVQVLNGGFYLRTVFFNQAACARKRGGKIRSVLGTQKFVDAVDRNFQVCCAITQGLNE